MSQPRWELDELVRRQGLVLLSSNFQLYQDLHGKFMRSLESQVSGISVYSVDKSKLYSAGT